MSILFIHGFGGCGALWRWQAAHFAGQGKVICPDLPGHGTRPWNGEDLDGIAGIMAGEVLAAGEEAVDVVASSFGGLVALKLWEQHPGMVRRIVFAGSLPRFTATDGFPAGLNVERIRQLAGQFAGDIRPVLEMFMRSLFTRKERGSDHYGQVRDLCREMPLPQREGLLGVLSLLEVSDLRSLLARFDKPALFLFGDSDYICPLAVAEPLRQLCPQAKMEAFTATGHFLFLSTPDVFNRRVERFLA